MCIHACACACASQSSIFITDRLFVAVVCRFETTNWHTSSPLSPSLSLLLKRFAASLRAQYGNSCVLIRRLSSLCFYCSYHFRLVFSLVVSRSSTSMVSERSFVCVCARVRVVLWCFLFFFLSCYSASFHSPLLGLSFRHSLASLASCLCSVVVFPVQRVTVMENGIGHRHQRKTDRKEKAAVAVCSLLALYMRRSCVLASIRKCASATVSIDTFAA